MDSRSFAAGDRLDGSADYAGVPDGPWVEVPFVERRHMLTAYLSDSDPQFIEKRNEALARTGSRKVECLVVNP
jgi:hypothetical protein